MKKAKIIFLLVFLSIFEVFYCQESLKNLTTRLDGHYKLDNKKDKVRSILIPDNENDSLVEFYAKEIINDSNFVVSILYNNANFNGANKMDFMSTPIKILYVSKKMRTGLVLYFPYGAYVNKLSKNKFDLQIEHLLLEGRQKYVVDRDFQYIGESTIYFFEDDDLNQHNSSVERTFVRNKSNCKSEINGNYMEIGFDALLLRVMCE